MSTFIIDVPMPAMGATVSELTIINIVVGPGTAVTKGQKLAELESDKSAFDFESPADGVILEVKGNKGEIKSSGQALFRMETADESLKHLEVAGAKPKPVTAPETGGAVAPATVAPASAGTPAKALVWTPRAIKMAQEAGLDYAGIHDIEATGPGGRVSGDDVAKYIASKK
jgi:pyruvate/2-oxoglutarate dehydrogenase complex dihydrolipoamide acyltransferase (E2) component